MDPKDTKDPQVNQNKQQNRQHQKQAGTADAMQNGCKTRQGKPDFMQRQVFRTRFGHLGHKVESPVFARRTINEIESKLNVVYKLKPDQPSSLK